jgi:hypothetical protein
MYQKSDPRSAMVAAAAKPAAPVTAMADAELAAFDATTPGIAADGTTTWSMRGQNFVTAYSDCAAGAVLHHANEPDESFLVVLDANASVSVTIDGVATELPGRTIAVLPPGAASVKAITPATLLRVFTLRSPQAASAANARSYAEPHPNVAPLVPWPAPNGGYRLRTYPIPEQPAQGRFGSVFRTSCLMINFLAVTATPRDKRKLSPHHHDDFEQMSLAQSGEWIHHIRWPWTPDATLWRDDVHLRCGSPSLCIIPPPALHTSEAISSGPNALIDIFSPPRLDFSMMDGWVLNAEDYPMPELR